VMIPLILQLGILLTPSTYRIFEITSINVREWLVILAVAVGGFLTLEFFKLAARTRRSA